MTSVPFVFCDVRSRDVERSRAFYSNLFGWQVADVDAGGKTIPFLTDGGAPWGGFTELGPADERQPAWVPYVPVADVDKAAAEAVELGATIVRPRMELPQGSLVAITEPGGATLCLWQDRG